MGNFFPIAPGPGFSLKSENDKKNSAKSENVMIKPKKFTDGSPSNSGKASLLISRGGKFGAWLSQSLMSSQQITITYFVNGLIGCFGRWGSRILPHYHGDKT